MPLDILKLPGPHAFAFARTHKARTHNWKLTTERSQGMPQDLELEEGIVLDPLVEDKVSHEPSTGGREERSNETSRNRRLPGLNVQPDPRAAAAVAAAAEARIRQQEAEEKAEMAAAAAEAWIRHEEEEEEAAAKEAVWLRQIDAKKKNRNHATSNEKAEEIARLQLQLAQKMQHLEQLTQSASARPASRSPIRSPQHSMTASSESLLESLLISRSASARPSSQSPIRPSSQSPIRSISRTLSTNSARRVQFQESQESQGRGEGSFHSYNRYA